jgi:hypothetical protein
MSEMVIAQIVQQTETLPADLQQQVLDYVKKLIATARRGTPGQDLLRFAGMIPAEDLRVMRQAIEDDCEQVDWHEW